MRRMKRDTPIRKEEGGGTFFLILDSLHGTVCLHLLAYLPWRTPQRPPRRMAPIDGAVGCSRLRCLVSGVPQGAILERGHLIQGLRMATSFTCCLPTKFTSTKLLGTAMGCAGLVSDLHSEASLNFSEKRIGLLGLSTIALWSRCWLARIDWCESVLCSHCLPVVTQTHLEVDIIFLFLFYSLYSSFFFVLFFSIVYSCFYVCEHVF